MGFCESASTCVSEKYSNTRCAMAPCERFVLSVDANW